MSYWFLIALGGMFSFAGMALVLKRLTATVPIDTVLLHIFVICTVCYGVMTFLRKTPVTLSWSVWSLVALAALFAFVGNLCDIESIRTAPNPGYASAVKSGQILLITLAAYFIFENQALNITGMLGVAMIAGGIVLLAMQ
jgi:multidrug transporter EmrE-like cation transporter